MAGSHRDGGYECWETQHVDAGPNARSA